MMLLLSDGIINVAAVAAESRDVLEWRRLTLSPTGRSRFSPAASPFGRRSLRRDFLRTDTASPLSLQKTARERFPAFPARVSPCLDPSNTP